MTTRTMTGKKTMILAAVAMAAVVAFPALLGAEQQSWGVNLQTAGNPAVNALSALASGGVLAAGSVSGLDADADLLALAVDIRGAVLWSSVLHGGDDVAWDIQETRDGGCVIAGGRRSADRLSWDVLVVKLDSAGDLEWERTFGYGFFAWGEAVIQTRDHGYVVAATRARTAPGAESDIWVLKLDPDGEPVWEGELEGYGVEEITGLQETETGSLILTGWSMPEQSPVSWVARLDPETGTGWNRAVPGFVADARLQPHGGVLLTGWDADPAAAGDDLWFMELDADGEPLWRTDLEGPVHAGAEQGILVGELVWSARDRRQTLTLTRFDHDGRLVWEQDFDCSEGFTPCPYLAGDGQGALVAGNLGPESGDGLWIIKLDPDGRCTGPGCPAAP